MTGQRDQPGEAEAPREQASAETRDAAAGSLRQDQPWRNTSADRTPHGEQHLQDRLERLPPGHPSSPYEDNGTRKPPMIRLRDLELPLPGEPGSDSRDLANEESKTRHSEGGDRNPEARRQDIEGLRQPTADGTRQPDSESWRESVPHLTERWERHKEKWPEAEQVRADATGDEAGSWRGDGGQYLDAEENLVSSHALERIGDAEKKLSTDLEEVRTEVPGAQFAGLDFRLKGEDRFKEKVSDEVRAKPERSIATIGNNMPDAIRYTFQLDSGSYVDGYWSTLRRIEQRGYELEFSRNSWNSSQYKGVNARWRTQSGQVFEVQFHTPESYEAKQLTHEAYERIRSPNISDQERGELYNIQSDVSRRVPLPDNVLEIPDYRKKED